MEWISIKDRVPDKDSMYLIFAPSADPEKPIIQTAWFDPDSKRWTLIVEYWAKAITHWMRLPDPPIA